METFFVLVLLALLAATAWTALAMVPRFEQATVEAEIVSEDE